MLLTMSGCAINFARRSPWDIQQLAELSGQLEQFRTLARLKAEEADELRRAKALLEQGIGSSEMSVGYDERGLVARVLEQVLFDSGKAELRSGALPVLTHVAQVLQEVPGQPIGIEGHTDNVPITRSGWADNQALSLARANAVADYLATELSVPRSRLTTIGYGGPAEDPAGGNRHSAESVRPVLSGGRESGFAGSLPEVAFHVAPGGAVAHRT
jgi:flagellar motor protein MotB